MGARNDAELAKVRLARNTAAALEVLHPAEVRRVVEEVLAGGDVPTADDELMATLNAASRAA